MAALFMKKSAGQLVGQFVGLLATGATGKQNMFLILNNFSAKYRVKYRCLVGLQTNVYRDPQFCIYQTAIQLGHRPWSPAERQLYQNMQEQISDYLRNHMISTVRYSNHFTNVIIMAVYILFSYCNVISTVVDQLRKSYIMVIFILFSYCNMI